MALGTYPMMLSNTSGAAFVAYRIESRASKAVSDDSFSKVNNFFAADPRRLCDWRSDSASPQ